MNFKKGAFFVGLPFTLIGGILFCLLSLPILMQTQESVTWPSTLATVQVCYVNPNAGSDGDLNQLIFNASYMVDGRNYTTDQRYLDDEGAQSWEGELYDFANAHPAGTTISIYYDPQNPEQTTIETGFLWRYALLAGFSLIFLFVGLGVMLSAFNGSKKKKSSVPSNHIEEEKDDDKKMGIERY